MSWPRTLGPQPGRTALHSGDQELGQGGLRRPLRGQSWGMLPGAEPGQGLTDWDVTCALATELLS